MNFARNQRDMALDNDPSFVCSSDSKIQKLRNRLRNFTNSRKKKPRTKFTKLFQSPSVINDVPGAIGEDEDEITLEDVDPLMFTQESVSLSSIV